MHQPAYQPFCLGAFLLLAIQSLAGAAFFCIHQKDDLRLIIALALAATFTLAASLTTSATLNGPSPMTPSDTIRRQRLTLPDGDFSPTNPAER